MGSVKSNCSIQSYVPALTAIADFGVEEVAVCTYQAISGAGKSFDTWPEMLDNVIPYIGGEEEKSEQEPMKMWGKMRAMLSFRQQALRLRRSACVCRWQMATWRRPLCG